MTATAPSKTLYVRNLNESVKLPILKQDLQTTFSQFGNVLNVIAHKNLRMRGQAFVVFEDLAGAEAALEQVRGFEYHGKKMDVQFAKSASDDTVVREQGEEAYEQHKKRRLEQKGISLNMAAIKGLEQRKAAEATNKAKRLQQTTQQPVRKPRPAAPPAAVQQHNPPNKVLFISNLPDTASKEDLIQIYGKFDGFREVRMVPGRKGIAFVEYDTEGQAGMARVNTSKLELHGNAVQVVFQRKIN